MRHDEHAPFSDDFGKNDMYTVAAKKEDVVNKPKHYISETGLEAIDVITAFTKGLDGVEAFCAGNALKYLCRWNHKNGTEDLRKAIWYINRLISIREKNDKDDENPSSCCWVPVENRN